MKSKTYGRYMKRLQNAKGLLIDKKMRPSELRELMEVRETDRLKLLMKRKLNDGLMPASTIVDDSMIKTCENCNDSRVWYGKNSMGWERNGCYPACCHHLADDEELHVCNHEEPDVVCDQWLPEGTKNCYNCGIQENCLLDMKSLLGSLWKDIGVRNGNPINRLSDGQAH